MNTSIKYFRFQHILIDFTIYKTLFKFFNFPDDQEFLAIFHDDFFLFWHVNHEQATYFQSSFSFKISYERVFLFSNPPTPPFKKKIMYVYIFFIGCDIATHSVNTLLLRFVVGSHCPSPKYHHPLAPRYDIPDHHSGGKNRKEQSSISQSNWKL